MKRLRIIGPMAVAVVAIAIIGFSVALAQENESDNSNTSRLATRVAEILGLDAAVVDNAIKQAREELRDEVAKKKLDSLVENGKLTQEEADEHLDWIQSKPEGIPAIGKQFFGKMGRHKGWKGHGRFFGPPNYFKGEFSFTMEDVQKKLNAMVEDGEITEAEATEKLKGIQLNKP